MDVIKGKGLEALSSIIGLQEEGAIGVVVRDLKFCNVKLLGVSEDGAVISEVIEA